MLKRCRKQNIAMLRWLVWLVLREINDLLKVTH